MHLKFCTLVYDNLRANLTRAQSVKNKTSKPERSRKWNERKSCHFGRKKEEGKNVEKWKELARMAVSDESNKTDELNIFPKMKISLCALLHFFSSLHCLICFKIFPFSDDDFMGKQCNDLFHFENFMHSRCFGVRIGMSGCLIFRFQADKNAATNWSKHQLIFTPTYTYTAVDSATPHSLTMAAQRQPTIKIFLMWNILCFIFDTQSFASKSSSLTASCASFRRRPVQIHQWIELMHGYCYFPENSLGPY